eukprot:2357728-Prymnesium_polylepis.5
MTCTSRCMSSEEIEMRQQSREIEDQQQSRAIELRISEERAERKRKSDENVASHYTAIKALAAKKPKGKMSLFEEHLAKRAKEAGCE